MNLRLILLVLCLAGNVWLATALLRHGSTASPAADAAAKKTAAPENLFPTTTPPAVNAAGAASTAAVSLADFSWSQIYAPDFALYLKQLRGFATPDRQLHDIIYGAVDAGYRPQRRALRPPAKKADDAKFWARRNYYSYAQQSTKEQRAQLRALQKQESELLKSLFGADFLAQLTKESGGIDWMEKQYGFIPKELREKASEIEQEMQEAKSEIYALNEGNMDQYGREDLRKLEKKFHDEMAKILTPEQLKEWDLRHSDAANQLKNDLSAFDPKEDEFRALFDYKQASDALNPQRDPDSDAPRPTAEERKANAEKQAALYASLTNAIGADRAKEYQLEQDYAYRSLIESGVAKESVFKLDDMKKEAQAAANKIRKDKTLTPEQRTAALNDIRTETQASINGLLGDKFAKRYSGQGGWWLNSIAPQQPPPSAP